MAILKILVTGSLSNNTYILHDGVSAVVIDPQGCHEVKDFLKAKGLKCDAVFLTHGHFDHISGAAGLQRDGAKVYIHTLDSPFTRDGNDIFGEYSAAGIFEKFDADTLIEDGFKYKFDDIVITAVHTPGHSPGSVCFLAEGKIELSKAAKSNKIIFSGDTLFAGGMGRTDFPGSNYVDMMRSLRRLFELPDDMPVLPGHDMSTTVGKEKYKT